MNSFVARNENIIIGDVASEHQIITLLSFSTDIAKTVKMPFFSNMTMFGLKWSPILSIELINTTNIQVKDSASIWTKLMNLYIRSIRGLNIKLSTKLNNNSANAIGDECHRPIYSNEWSNIHAFQIGKVSIELDYTFGVKVSSCFNTDNSRNNNDNESLSIFRKILNNIGHMIGRLKFQIEIEPKIKAFIGIIRADDQNIERNEFGVIDIDDHE